MKTRKLVAWLLCIVMLCSTCAVFPAYASLDDDIDDEAWLPMNPSGGGGSSGGGSGGNSGGGTSGGGSGGSGGVSAGGDTITITFTDGIGQSDAVSQSADKGQAVTLRPNTFTREGYRFVRWKDASGAVYNDGATVTFNENVVLTAEWQYYNFSSIRGADLTLTYGCMSPDDSCGGYIEAEWNGNTFSQVSITPYPAHGYAVSSVDVVASNGIPVGVAQNVATGITTFSMPQSDVTVTVSFSKAGYRINVDPYANAEIRDLPTMEYFGETVLFSVTPDEGYSVKVSVLDMSNNPLEVTEIEGKYSFVMPAGSPTVRISTVPIEHYICYNLGNINTSVGPERAATGTKVYLTFNHLSSAYDLAFCSIITLSGVPVGFTIEDGTETDYVSFTMPAESVCVDAYSAFLGEITYRIGSGVTLVSAPDKAHAGDEVTVSFDLEEGYELEELNATGDRLSEFGTESPFTFTMPDESVIVQIDTREIRHNITNACTGNGSVTVPQDARLGSTVAVSLVPDQGYHVGEFSLKNAAGEDIPYTQDPVTGAVSFRMPDSDVYITTHFWGGAQDITYTVDDSEHVHLVTAPTSAYEGQDVALRFTVDDGYKISSVFLRNTDNNYFQWFTQGEIDFTMPGFAVEVEIVSTHPEYSVSKLVDSDLGNIESNLDSAYYGDEVVFTASALDPTQYKVTEVWVKGDSGAEIETGTYYVGDTLCYYFIMPTESVNIFAKLEKYYTVTFVPNGGFGEEFSMEVVEWETVSLPECTFTPDDGKYFAGWEFGDLYYKPGTNVSFTQNKTVKAHWNDSSVIYAGIGQTNGALSLDLYVRICHSRPEDHTLMISGGDGTFEYTLDDAVFTQDCVFNKDVYKISVELTPSRLVEGFAYVVDDLDANGEYMMACAGVFRFAADPTASAASVEVDDCDAGVTQIQPSDGEFLFELPPYGPTVTVTYPGSAPLFYGDVNGDGEITARDAILIKQYIANYDDETGTSSVELPFGAADVNGDYTISAKDATLVMQYIANYDDETGTSTVVLGPQD